MEEKEVVPVKRKLSPKLIKQKKEALGYLRDIKKEILREHSLKWIQVDKGGRRSTRILTFLNGKGRFQHYIVSLLLKDLREAIDKIYDNVTEEQEKFLEDRQSFEMIYFLVNELYDQIKGKRGKE